MKSEIMNYTNRVILLIDMDCFYCQVEENLNPTLKGKPIAVVQYNQWRGGGIIAVNYPARDRGVTRHMRGAAAKEKCPNIILAKVPEVRGKADLTKYREAGKRVADVLQNFTPKLERASVDEAYLDITEVVEKSIEDKTYNVTLDKLPNTFVVGSSTADFIDYINDSREYNESDFKLAVGGIIAEKIRAEVYRITGYRCSAGIAHNKILAKLVCGLHKPNKQTILPHEAVPELYKTLPIGKIKSLGGKFGNTVAEKLGIEHMGELSRFSQKELAKKLDEKAACWLYNIARGIDMEPVNIRLISKSIGCCKRFPGRSALLTQEDVGHWLNELAEEISERLEKDFEENNRKAKQMVVNFAQKANGEEVSSTRTHPLNSYEQRKIFENGLKVIQKNCLKTDGSYMITFLGISVANFQDVKKVKEITSFFKNMEDNVKKKIEYVPEPQVSIADTGDTSISVNNESDIKASVEIQNSILNTPRCGKVEPAPHLTGTNDSSPYSASVYSNSTEECDTDYNDYVYYEQLHPSSIADQNFIADNMECRESDNDSDISKDSISQEFNFEPIDVTAREAEAPSRSSFFTKYFNDNLNHNSNKVGFNCRSSLKSEVLVDVDVDDDHLDSSGHDDGGSKNDSVEAGKIDFSICDNKTCDISNEESRINDHFNDAGNGEANNTCSECGKVINYWEYQSHMDYHFAVNMVKSEAHLYKTESNKRGPTNPKTKLTRSSVKHKQKEGDVGKCKPIAQYFRNSSKTETEQESGQSCSDCNKRIRPEDWNVHMDFHAAKKLHLEMNVTKTKPEVPVAGSRKVKGQKNIVGFFKPS